MPEFFNFLEYKIMRKQKAITCTIFSTYKVMDFIFVKCLPMQSTIDSYYSNFCCDFFNSRKGNLVKIPLRAIVTGGSLICWKLKWLQIRAPVSDPLLIINSSNCIRLITCQKRGTKGTESLSGNLIYPLTFTNYF